MPPLPTVLLRHDTPDGSHHFDWLLADPDDPEGLLWTARTAAPSDQWQGLDTWALEPIAPHRRAYLTFEGDISGHRGRVTRVDEGTFEPIAWTTERKVINLCMNHFQGRIMIEQSDDSTWRASREGDSQR